MWGVFQPFPQRERTLITISCPGGERTGVGRFCHRNTIASSESSVKLKDRQFLFISIKVARCVSVDQDDEYAQRIITISTSRNHPYLTSRFSSSSSDTYAMLAALSEMA